MRRMKKILEIKKVYIFQYDHKIIYKVVNKFFNKKLL